ncbi:hypothetical protein WJX77_011196 [Trebouxia sp. C0004]
MPHLQPSHLPHFRQLAQKSIPGLSACCWSVLQLFPGQHFRQLHASTALQRDLPAVLAQWVQQQGGKVDGVAVQPAGDGTGCGLWSAQDLKQGQSLVHLSKQCQLTYDNDTNPELLALIEQVPQALWGARLALQVLSHRVQGSQSAFDPYIRNLPVGVAGLPMFFSRDPLRALEYAPVTRQVQMRCQWLLHFAREALQPLPGTDADPFSGTLIDANALGWALAVVTSRAFRVGGPSQPAAMLPLIDMCNHSFAPNCKLQPLGNGSLQLVALQDIPQQQPLLLSYGGLSNDFLLMDYGFVMADNPFDRVQLSFNLDMLEAAKEVAHLQSFHLWATKNQGPSSASTDLPIWQEQALTHLNLWGPNANLEVMLGGVPPVDPRLLAAVRILYCKDPSELQGRALAHLGAWGAFLNPANEVRALRTIAAICTMLLSQWSSVPQEDQQALSLGMDSAGLTLSSDMKLAMQFRLEKKRLLLHAVNEISKQIQALPGNKV